VVFEDIHVGVNIATALIGVAASAWMVVHLRAGHAKAFWFGVQLTGFVLGVIDYVSAAHVLFTSQAMASLGFGVLIVNTVRQVSRSQSRPYPLT
jgi:hypothetical protein